MERKAVLTDVVEPEHVVVMPPIVIVVINTVVREPAIVEEVVPHVEENIQNVSVLAGMNGVEVLVYLVVVVTSIYVPQEVM